jgi:hypothetical protein
VARCAKDFMNELQGLTEEELTQALAYVGLVLVAFELVKSLIIDPIKLFYRDTTFSGRNMPFKSYEFDVQSRHKDQFEACLLYLRDFMQAIDDDNIKAIQELRKHRNELAHDLVNRLHKLEIAAHAKLFLDVDKALFRLSNYRTYMEIGADPKFRDVGIDWNTITGREYHILQEVLRKLKMFA